MTQLVAVTGGKGPIGRRWQVHAAAYAVGLVDRGRDPRPVRT